MSRIGPNALSNNPNDLKKLNTSSMGNGGSSEHIQWKLEQNEKHKTLKLMESSGFKKNAEHMAIKLELVDNAGNGKQNGEKTETNTNINQNKNQKDEAKQEGTTEEKLIEEKKNDDKQGKKSKQVFFDPDRDKIITVENWKKFNVEKTKNCHCTLI